MTSRPKYVRNTLLCVPYLCIRSAWGMPAEHAAGALCPKGTGLSQGAKGPPPKKGPSLAPPPRSHSRVPAPRVTYYAEVLNTYYAEVRGSCTVVTDVSEIVGYIS